MKFGAYTACLHDRPLDETLKILAELGLNSAEINAGGFIPAPHLPSDDLLSSAGAREDYLGRFAQAGVTLTGLNVNGNPLNPDPAVGRKHAADVRRAIDLAAALGVRRVVTMSGLPEAHSGSTTANWVVNPWDSQFLDILDYQWNEVAVPFWRDINARAAAADVKVCIEMHPQNLVFNPPTLQRLVEQTNATHVGAEMDPSHLFWQGMDPVACVKYLGELVFHAAAKDTRINTDNIQVYGVLDDRFTRTRPEENPLNLGGRNTLNQWPQSPSWEFVAVGRGHSVDDFWVPFLRALHAVDPEIAVNIEHEDQEFDQIEGLRLAAENLLQAATKAGLRNGH
ncbi:sugar phosphate isomerase/epimerase family protein [Actinoplanes sp. NPDC051859]|uniref:sugar phosphate isomerase/epimerase family protein n=1 Tax=Actinoplanes sp. NPDC051859 TaxID=3363909 RepID=UPI0037BBD6E5